MAKKRKIVKKPRVKKIRNKKIISNSKFFKIVLILGFVLFLGFIKLANIDKAEQVKTIPLNNKNLITPYPAVSPAPTPAPLTGYCLKVPILTYHHIQPQTEAILKKETSLSVDIEYFDKQMEYLISNGFTPIFANELISALVAHSPLPGKPIMVTMDDGYADNYNYALPILKKYSVKANLMLASGLVGSSLDMLTWNQVREMKSSGLMYFTNHTWSHSSVIRSSQSKIENEIDTGKTQIEQYTGQNVNVFTYPYGEFNSNAVQTLQEKGYIGGFTTIPGHYQCDSFIMTLHRNHIGNALLSAYGL